MLAGGRIGPTRRYGEQDYRPPLRKRVREEQGREEERTDGRWRRLLRPAAPGVGSRPRGGFRRVGRRRIWRERGRGRVVRIAGPRGGAR